MLMLVACQEELFHLELGWNILNSVIRELYPTWRVSKYGVISEPYFPVFLLNTEIYAVIRFTPYSIQTQENTDQK